MGLAAFVQVTGLGIDLLLLAAAVLVLLALERSVGDWIAEWFGPFAAAALLGVLVLSFSWYFLSSTLGRSKTDRFFMEAERRGYRTVYYETPAAARTAEESSPAASSTPASPATPNIASGSAVATKGEDAARSAGGASAQKATRDVSTPESAGKEASSSSLPAAKTSTSASGWVGALFRRDSTAGAALPTTIAVSVSPARVELARRTTITATVTAASGTVTHGTVEFMVNGLGAGRRAVSPAGTATTIFVPQMAGTYEVRARFVGTSEHTASTSNPSILNVVGRR